jgi:hypothetical protein
MAANLDTVTLKLDNHAHFRLGKTLTIGTPTTDSARRIRTPHLIDDRPGRLAEIQPLVPSCQVIFVEHRGAVLSASARL